MLAPTPSELRVPLKCLGQIFGLLSDALICLRGLPDLFSEDRPLARVLQMCGFNFQLKFRNSRSQRIQNCGQRLLRLFCKLAGRCRQHLVGYVFEFGLQLVLQSLQLLVTFGNRPDQRGFPFAGRGQRAVSRGDCRTDILQTAAQTGDENVSLGNVVDGSLDLPAQLSFRPLGGCEFLGLLRQFAL